MNFCKSLPVHPVAPAFALAAAVAATLAPLLAEDPACGKQLPPIIGRACRANKSASYLATPISCSLSGERSPT